MIQDPKTLALYTASALAVCGSVLALTFAYGEMVSVKHPQGQNATITVTGEGEATAVPDIATITFTVREVAKTVPEAQKAVEAKVTAAKNAIKAMNISDKDFKTLSYTINPHYENQTTGYCTGYICPPSKSVISGYEAAQTLQVKVRQIDDAGTVLAKIGEANITEVSGPEFTVDNMDAITAEAKAKAVKDAKEKGEVIAQSLGVDLGQIVGYSEDNGAYPVPMMARSYGLGGADSKMESVSLPQGETLLKERVSITYELR